MIRISFEIKIPRSLSNFSWVETAFIDRHILVDTHNGLNYNGGNSFFGSNGNDGNWWNLHQDDFPEVEISSAVMPDNGNQPFMGIENHLEHFRSILIPNLMEFAGTPELVPFSLTLMSHLHIYIYICVFFHIYIYIHLTCKLSRVNLREAIFCFEQLQQNLWIPL